MSDEERTRRNASRGSPPGHDSDALPERVRCPLAEAAHEVPDAPALIAPDHQLSFVELDRLVAGTATQIASAGVREGDRLALFLENDWRTVVLLLAALRAGVIACPLSTRLPDPHARRAGARLLVSDRPLPDAIGPDDLIDRGAESLEGARFGDTAEAVVRPDRPATLVYTSGSSGAARAALHTYGSHYFSAAGSNENIGLQPGDRWLLSLPLYHVGGLAILFRCVLGRAAVVVPESGAPIEASVAGASHVSLVSTQLRRLLRSIHSKQSRIDSLKAVLLGGSAMPAGLVDAALETGLPVHTSYGLTEMASQVATTPPGADRDALRTSGHVLRYRELRIDDRGQILVRGPTRFAGYADGRSLDRPFDEGGWFATGDLGRIDDQERLVVLGRIDNLFVSGGENILPEEIEAVLGSVRTVERAVVVPVADEEYGHRPVAFVRTVDDLDPQRLRDAVAAALPRFMVPEAFYPWPADAAEHMKIDRAWLRRRAEALRDPSDA